MLVLPARQSLPRTLLRCLTLLLALIALSLLLILYFTPNAITPQSNLTPPTANTVAPPGREDKKPGLPVRLKIPGINIDSVIEYVGLTPTGAMDITKSLDNVAWFKLGPRPGENGSAVIAGHYGWDQGRGSVFNSLHKLQKGDKIHVDDDKGATVTFTVRESRKYDPNADASSVFKSNDGNAHLNLITCNGTWNESQKTYSNRLVLFTDKT